MIFLQGYGIGPIQGSKIIKHYKERTIDKIKKNPYRLAKDIRGIGFKTADKMALEMGIKEDASIRVQAYIIYTLYELSQQGHCYYPYIELIKLCAENLSLEFTRIKNELLILKNSMELIIEKIDSDVEAVYLKHLHFFEKEVSEKLKNILSKKNKIFIKDSIIIIRSVNLKKIKELSYQKNKKKQLNVLVKIKSP